MFSRSSPKPVIDPSKPLSPQATFRGPYINTGSRDVGPDHQTYPKKWVFWHDICSQEVNPNKLTQFEFAAPDERTCLDWGPGMSWVPQSESSKFFSCSLLNVLNWVVARCLMLLVVLELVCVKNKDARV